MLVLFASGTGLFVLGLCDDNSTPMAVKFRVYGLILLTVVTPLCITIYFLARTGGIWAKEFALGILIYLAFSHGVNAFDCL